MEGHIIVCGDDPLGMRIIEQLRAAGREIAVVFSSAELARRGHRGLRPHSSAPTTTTPSTSK